MGVNLLSAELSVIIRRRTSLILRDLARRLPMRICYLSMLLLFLNFELLSNPTEPVFKVTGKIKDSQGFPMPAVNVLVKGTTHGTTSDAEGNYSIDVEAEDILVFTFIGYKANEVPVNGRTTIEVAMEEDITNLKEVEINGGYYTTTKNSSTGNIVRISSEEISKQPVVNPLQALQGRTAGVEIVQMSGVPGSAMKIQIRGQNSLRSEGNYPLYVIDGVPVASAPATSYSKITLSGLDPLNTINASTIESIEILKDADATAIYGSRGANGVVLITTKKAANDLNGRTKLEASFYRGAGNAPRIKDLMDSRQYLEMRREAFKNDNLIPSSNPTDIGFNGRQYAPDLAVWDTTRYTDWQDVLYGGTANTSDAQFALSGGNSGTSFRFNVGYHSETTVFPGDFGYSRMSGGLAVKHRSADNKFNITVSTSYGYDNNDLFDGDVVNPGIALAPVAPSLYNEDGSLNWQIGMDGLPTWTNPLAVTLCKQNVKNYNLITNALMQYEILPGLSLKTSLGYTRMTGDEVIILPIASIVPTSPVKENSTRVTNTSSKSWIMEPQVVYTKRMGKGRLNALVGSSWQASVYKHLSLIGSRYPSDELLGILISAAEVTRSASLGSEYRYNAVFGRLSYNWDDKYMVNVTARRDGSSRFGPDKRFANFGAVGIGWMFSNEGFIRDRFSLLSFGKLRGSYGSAGSDVIGDYGYLDAYTTTATPYQNVAGLYPSSLANPDYSWEVVKKLEAGLDLGFIGNRIYLSTSWYRNRSSSQLVGEPLSRVTGFSTVTANFPATVQNSGWEFVLNTMNTQGKAVTWSSSVNLTVPKNELIAYPNIKGSAYADRYLVGEPLNIVRLYHSTGVNPQTGFYQFEDIGGDGLFNMDDRKTIVNLGREFYGGFTNTVSYKGFEFSFLFEFVRQKGAGRFLLFDYYPGKSPLGTGNQSANVLDRWQQDGDVTDVQKFTQSIANGSVYSRAKLSDMAYVDASFLRLKTISMGYNFPAELINRIRLQQARIFVQGQNLLTFTKYPGLDPQSPGAKRLPALKMLTCGVQFTF